jgi:hypothetical protein
MIRSLRQLRRTMVLWYLLFLALMAGLSSYTAWRLSVEARSAAHAQAAMYADNFGQFIDNSLQASDWVLASMSTHAGDVLNSSQLDPLYQQSLVRAPFVRSLSVLDSSSTIIASSNQANLGVVVSAQNFVPPPSGDFAALRVGLPWQGRDFFNARLVTDATALDPTQPWFIPITRSIQLGERALTLLVALNPDYFAAQFAHRLEQAGARLRWYRLDGVLLLDSRARAGRRSDRRTWRIWAW